MLLVPVPAAMSRPTSPGRTSTAATTALRQRRPMPSDRTSLVRSYRPATSSHIPATSWGCLSRLARLMGAIVTPRHTVTAVTVLAPPRLLARTVEVDLTAPLVSHLPADVPPADLLAWVREGEGLVGWG